MTEQDKNEFHMRLVQLEMEMKANTRITAGLQEDMTVLLDILGTAKSGLKVLGGLGNLLKWAAGIVTAGGVLWGIFQGQWPK